MKAKRIRRQLREAAQVAWMNNYRALWARLVELPSRTRWRLAWLMVRGNADIDAAAKKRKAGA